MGLHLTSSKKIIFGVVLFAFFVNIKLEASEVRQQPLTENRQNLTVNRAIETVEVKYLQNKVSYLQSFNNRSTWEKQWEAANWVSEEFKKIRLIVDIHKYEYNGRIWPNVIATMRGKERPEEVIMLIAHIDSTSDNPQNVSPGADDNASGVAAILEVARVLSQIQVARTIMFVIFTNEELGRAGSKAYARQAKKDKVNIKAVINLDILGYNRPTWPFYWDALIGHDTLKHKVKAIYRMARNYFFGMIYGKNVIKVAGREPNRNLVKITSKILSAVSELRVRELISNDCG